MPRPRFIASTLLACAGLSLGMAASSHAASQYAATQYPIVLVHGLGGSGANGGNDYWVNIPETLRQSGADVYAADLSPYNDESARGEQLIRQIRSVMAATGTTKVNLIGHSQGGLTSRYAAAVAPTLVASVTTIGTPHRGTPLADFVNDTIPRGLAQNLLATLINVQALQTSDNPTNALGALWQLSTSGAARFNTVFPAGLASDCKTSGPATVTQSGQVQRLFSWTGNTAFTNPLDIADWGMLATSAIILASGQGANDGYVPVCSARFGQFVGTYRWNHTDEVNQTAGVIGWSAPDPLAIMRTHANRLKTLGL